MSPRLPTAEEWASWNSQHPTDTLREFALSKIEALKECWANGEFSYALGEPTHLKNAEALGEIKAWTIIAKLDYEDILTELGADDEHKAV